MARTFLKPNPENASVYELREASRVGTFETATRCTAIQFLILGSSREQVCKALLISVRSLQNWIKAFNERGIDGLITRKRTGRPRKINGKKARELAVLIDKPEKADRTFWTAKAFHGYIRKEYKIDCSYETVVRFFHQEGFALKVPQPWPDRQDEQKRKAYREELKKLCQQSDVDIWFADESGFEGNPRPRQRWDRKGRKTRVTKNGDHLRMNVLGMVCPRSGQFFAIEATHVDSDVFQAFLDEANKYIQREKRRNIVILDNATWHKRKSLNWHGLEHMFLPPYSPDLNPIEKIWLIMKARWFNNHVCRNRKALIERLDKAILDVINTPHDVQRTTSFGKNF